MQEALNYISLHGIPGSKHSDQVKELWKKKALRWPGCSLESEFLVPSDEREETEHLHIAFRESLRRQHIEDKVQTPSATLVNEGESDLEGSPESLCGNDDTEAAEILIDLMNANSSTCQ